MMDIVTPEKVKLSSSRLGRIRPVVERLVNAGKFAGVATLIARHGEVAHMECVGVMDRETGQPIQGDTLFRIHSMTKPITSLALLMLYEEGRVRLNDPVSRFIPAFKALKVYRYSLPFGMELGCTQREITVHDLLTHTAGLTYGYADSSPVDGLYRQVDISRSDRSLKAFVDALVHLPLAYQPGTAWRYSVATDVVGHLVELIAGMSLDQFFAEHIFQPLGMVDTGFVVPLEKVDRLSTEYALKADGELEIVDRPPTSVYTKPRQFLSGGGGLVSTLADYLRFAQMLLNMGELDGTRLVSRKTIELMTTNHLPPQLLPYGVSTQKNGQGFGLGVSVVMDVAQYGNLGSAGMYGWDGAANTRFWVDPAEQLIGILMTQSMPVFHSQLLDDFQVLAYQAIAD
jgi:CubicO group peptidase (beta-lactamase class C family)